MAHLLKLPRLQIFGLEDVTPEEIQEVNSAGDMMTPEAIMSVAAIEYALEDVRQNMGTEDAPSPGELTMPELSQILEGADTFKECQRE